MNDYHIRKSFKKKLLSKYSNSNDCLILEELGLCHGSNRIDLAVINGLMHGYEIKSDKDTLARLPDQLTAYNSVFDKVTIILAPRHAYKAINLIPDWWGIQIAEMGSRGGVKFHNLRKACSNPNIDKLSLAKLLWKQEALEILDEINSSKGFVSKSRLIIYRELCQNIELNRLRKEVRGRIKGRLNWRVDEQRKLYGD